MARRIVLTSLLGLLMLAGVAELATAGSSLGAGIHYLRTVGGIKDDPNIDWNADSFGFVGSYQFSLPLVKIEGDLEWVPDFGGSDKSLFQPQAYGLIGGLLYGGLGIGVGHFDGDWLDPFYALRAGVSLGLTKLSVDVNINYRFQSTDVGEVVRDADLDQFTLGAIVRFDI